MFEGLPAYASGSDAVQMILDFYDFFTEVRSRADQVEEALYLIH